jgi:hypothetical protein
MHSEKEVKNVTNINLHFYRVDGKSSKGLVLMRS